MPGFLIPNGISGQTAEELAQASPDSVDFSILSNASYGIGVLTGCVVAAQASPNATVQVTAGAVLIGSQIQQPSAAASLSIAANSSGNPRFDLVIYRLGTGFMVLQGTPAAAPFTAFPVPTYNTDIVLAAVFVANGFTTITNAEIINKSVQLPFNSWNNVPPPITQNYAGAASGTALKTLTVVPLNVGDILMLQVYSAGATSTPTAVSGGGVTTWHKVANINTNSTYGDLALWYGVVTTAASATLTITTTASGTIYLTAFGFTAGLGSGTNWAVDQTSTPSASTGASGSWPAVYNSGYVPELYFGCASHSAGGGGGSDTGFTLFSNGVNNTVWYNSPGAPPGSPSSNELTPSFTCTSGDNQAIAVTLAPSAPPSNLWIPYTPQWTAASTAPSIGNGTLAGRYNRLGPKTMAFRVSLQIGSTTAQGTGAWSFGLPAQASLQQTGAPENQLGNALVNVGIANYYPAMCLLATGGTTFGIWGPTTTGDVQYFGAIASTTYSLATGQWLICNGVYETA